MLAQGATMLIWSGGLLPPFPRTLSWETAASLYVKRSDIAFPSALSDRRASAMWCLCCERGACFVRSAGWRRRTRSTSLRPFWTHRAATSLRTVAWLAHAHAWQPMDWRLSGTRQSFSWTRGRFLRGYLSPGDYALRASLSHLRMRGVCARGRRKWPSESLTLAQSLGGARVSGRPFAENPDSGWGKSRARGLFSLPL